MNRDFIGVILIVAVLSGLLGGYAAIQFTNSPSRTPTGSQTAAAAPTNPEINASNITAANSTVYRDAYQKLMDSVVSIKVINSAGRTSQGTGFVYDGNGHIVTNNHVVSDGEVVEVRFRQGEWRSTQLVGQDRYSDLAVLKVDNMPDYIEPLPVANQNPAPGQIVMALGNPFGLQETITHGIISGVNRSMATTGGFEIPDTIQTDAPINPGNSGGPLVNTDGVVVGVNRAKQGDNIGFAISPVIVQRVVPALTQNGDYAHPYIGIRMTDISPVIAAANSLEQNRGVLVVETVNSGPSEQKLQESQVRPTQYGSVPVGGDVILAIDGRQISSPQDLSSYIATQTKPGETVELTVLRDGRRQTVQVTLDKRPEPAQSTLRRFLP